MVVGLLGDRLDQIRPQIDLSVRELDVFGHRHSVLGDFGRPEGLVQNHVSPLGPEGDLYGISESVCPD